MLFTIVVRFPGAADREFAISDGSLTGVVTAAWRETFGFLRPRTLRGVLGHVEPYLPAIVEAAGAGLAGQLGVQVAAALVRHVLDGTHHRDHPSMGDGDEPVVTATLSRHADVPEDSRELS
jgi:hypothetical protein